MGFVADQLDALTVRATSADRSLGAVATGGVPEYLELRAGAYREHTDASAESQLAVLATELSAGHEQGVDEVLGAVGLRRRAHPARARDAAERSYLEEIARLTVVGRGSEGLVRFKTTGLRQWWCRVAQGTVVTLSEAEFVEEALTALRTAHAQFSRESLLINELHFPWQADTLRG